MRPTQQGDQAMTPTPEQLAGQSAEVNQNSPKESFLCRLGWHGPGKNRRFNGASANGCEAWCVRCKLRLLDFGAWCAIVFSALYLIAWLLDHQVGR